MCEANAYLIRDDGEEELFFKDVDVVQQVEDGLLLRDIYGHQKTIRARIRELALVEHKIILER
jgi:predicted RNA-binding protein